MPATPSSTLPMPAAANTGRRLGLMLLLVLALPLLAALTPQYEAANTLIAPLQPALALALAATARVGWRALPAVALGALLIALAWPLTEPNAAQVVDALVLLAQAAFGGLLMRRSSRSDDLALDSNPAIRRLVAVALACGLIGGLAELLGDLLLPGANVTRPGVAALVRGTADAASVLLLVPVVLAWATPPRLRWATRRRSVALPMLVLVLLLLAALAGIHERDREQALARFERDADVVYSRAQALLDAPVQAVLALRGAMTAATTPLIGAPFDNLARPWLARTAGLAELGWLEAARSEAGAPTVRHLLPAGANAVGAPVAAADALAARPAMRPALVRALAQADAVVMPMPAAAPESPDGPDPRGAKPAAPDRQAVLVFQALDDAGIGGPRQVVFGTVLVDRLLAPLMAARADGLQACLFDADPRAERRRLYGPASCDTPATTDGQQFSREAGFEFGGRRWSMRISQPVRTPGGVWLFALPALAGGGLLATLLLTLTGRMQRLETEARTRSLDMQRDIDQLRAQLQRQERTMDGVFDAVQSGVALVEADGRILRANAAFAELVGRSVAELRQHSIDDLLQDDDRPQQQRILALLQDAGDEPLHHSLRLRLAAGKVLPALLTLRPLRERDGRVGGAVCAVHDLSESLRRRQAERVLGDVLELNRGDGAGPAAVLAPLQAGTGPRPRVPVAGGAAAAAPEGLQRILCIHGEGARSSLLDTSFADRPRVQLHHADNASDGLVMAETEAPHLVLLDLDLPGGDGLALLQQLSSDARTRAIPVIVLSNDPRPDRIDAAFGAGARAYLSQPIDSRQLLAAVDELI